MKYYLVQKEEDGSLFRTTCDSLQAAQKVLQDHLKWEREDGGRAEKCDTNHYCVYDGKSLTITEYYIEKGNKSTKSNNQQLTLSFNNQNQTTMPTKKSSAEAPKRDSYNRVIGNPYQTKVKGKAYMKVPERMVTLPAKNHFITARKHQTLSTTYKDKNGNTQHNIAVYVMGYSNLKGTYTGSDGQQHTRRSYFVARQFNVGGAPKLSLYRYVGYNRATARRVFFEIPCTSTFWLQKDGTWKQDKGITAAEIVQARKKAQERAKANRGYDANGATLRR